MNKLSLAWLTTAALFIGVGCGGNVVGGSGGGGAGGSTSAGGGTGTTSSTTSTVPEQCAVQTDLPAPYAVQFKFTVGTNQSAFLAEDCYTVFHVKACADGYKDAVPLNADCTVDCSDTNGCVECGACPSGAISITEGAAHTVDWSGVTYTFDTNLAGCTCHSGFNALAGKYRVNVPVYQTEQDAIDQTNGVEISVDFELPAPNGVVEIPVGLQPI